MHAEFKARRATPAGGPSVSQGLRPRMPVPPAPNTATENRRLLAKQLLDTLNYATQLWAIGGAANACGRHNRLVDHVTGIDCSAGISKMLHPYPGLQLAEPQQRSMVACQSPQTRLREVFTG